MHHWRLAMAHHGHVEVLHHLLGHRVWRAFTLLCSFKVYIKLLLIPTYYDLIDTAVGQGGERSLVQVHDRVVGPLVPELVANGPFCHLLTTGSVWSPTIR